MISMGNINFLKFHWQDLATSPSPIGSKKHCTALHMEPHLDGRLLQRLQPLFCTTLVLLIAGHVFLKKCRPVRWVCMSAMIIIMCIGTCSLRDYKSILYLGTLIRLRAASVTIWSIRFFFLHRNTGACSIMQKNQPTWMWLGDTWCHLNFQHILRIDDVLRCE